MSLVGHLEDHAPPDCTATRMGRIRWISGVPPGMQIKHMEPTCCKIVKHQVNGTNANYMTDYYTAITHINHIPYGCAMCKLLGYYIFSPPEGKQLFYHPYLSGGRLTRLGYFFG